MIMYTFPIRPDDLAVLQAYGRQHKTPLVAIHSAGFYSYFRIFLQGAFPIVDTHPDETATTDLRLLTPWPALAEFAKELTKDIDGLDAHQHGHLPYVVILLHYLEWWRETHDGTNPSTYQEKLAFRRLVQEAARRDNPEGGEENFDEAVAAVLKTITPSTLPSSLREVFEYKRTHPVGQADSSAHANRPVEWKEGEMLTRPLARRKLGLLDHSRRSLRILREAQLPPSTG